MKFINKKEDFTEWLSIISHLIDMKARLPDQVFKTKFSRFFFFDFDQIFTAHFFNQVREFSLSIDENQITLGVIDPHPEEYFFHHFGKYSVIQASINDAGEEYVRHTQEDPGNSPADAVAFNSTVVFLHSDSEKWGIYGDHDFGLGIIGYTDDQLQGPINTIWSSDSLYDAEKAFEHIYEMAYNGQNSEVLKGIRKKLIRNYGT